MRMASEGQIELFDSRKDERDAWSRRFDQWLSISPYAAGDDGNNKKHAAFCTFIGSETFKLLCTLCTEKARGMHLCCFEGQTKQTVWNKETSFGRTLSFLCLQATG